LAWIPKQQNNASHTAFLLNRITSANIQSMNNRAARFIVFALLGIQTAFGAERTVLRDLEYARVGGTSLKLDLHRCGEQKGPLLLWVHGGAWRSGSKASMPLAELVCAGYPVASVEYRLSTVAQFPAQIHDLKAAIRFLRARGAEHGVDARVMVVAGDSAGGHLAALMGVSNGEEKLEGKIGRELDQSSDVQGVISFYGAGNLTTILSQSTPHGLKVRVPALDLLLGGQPDANQELADLARLASPVFHVDKSDPPLLLLHGDQDPQMPINQAHELEAAYKKAGAKVRFEVVHGAGHGGKVFYDAERLEIVKAFLSAIKLKQ
jgi:acetyl esterase/lipase